MNYSANPGAAWRVPARQRYYEHTLNDEKLKIDSRCRQGEIDAAIQETLDCMKKQLAEQDIVENDSLSRTALFWCVVAARFEELRRSYFDIQKPGGEVHARQK